MDATVPEVMFYLKDRIAAYRAENPDWKQKLPDFSLSVAELFA